MKKNYTHNYKDEKTNQKVDEGESVRSQLLVFNFYKLKQLCKQVIKYTHWYRV